MKTLSKLVLTALCLLALSAPAAGQVTPKAYAPEDLGQLSLRDQERVIRLEYEEQSGGQRIPDDQLRFYLDQVNRSDWGFSRIKRDIADSLGGGQTPNPGGSMRCESNDNRERTCTTPWSGPSRLVQQLSGASCIEGRSWFSAHGQVTVRNGCRGQFAQSWSDGGGQYPYPGQNQSITCESQGSGTRTCPTPWRGPSQVSRQKSDTPCIEGRNWTSQGTQVTVWGGCRAVFSPRWQGGGHPGYDQTVRCESTNNRSRTCDLPWRGATRVVRQLSDTRCTQGYSWEASNGQVTVTRGCRAEFGPGGSDWPGHARRVTCSSDEGRYTRCHWPPGQGEPRLVRQLSRDACIEGRSWGMESHNTIWVSQGCRAEFGD
jgi:hypothetical protein